jgi:subtilase family serine protease
MTSSRPNIKPGETVTISTIVKNMGNKAGGKDSTLRVVGDNCTAMEYTTPNLDPQAEASPVDYRCTCPAVVAESTTIKITATADYNKAIDENDETNNVATMQIPCNPYYEYLCQYFV